jgi:hypothetical protein
MVLHVSDGRVIRDTIGRFWNVTASGEVVGTGLDPHLRAGAAARQVELAYEATDPAGWWPARIGAAAEAMATAARYETSGRSPAERRKIVKAFGQMFLREPS